MTDTCYPAEAAEAALIADQLALGRTLDLWSLAFVILTGAGLFMVLRAHNGSSLILFSCGMVVAALQKYYALRTQLDSAIFRRWAEEWQHGTGSPEAAMSALDWALGKDGAICRPLADRGRGARKLLTGQTLCFLGQMICFLAGVWLLM